MKPLKSEVVIVGAGPAGCALSVLLARSGVKTTLVDRHVTFDRTPRHNLFLPPALRLLKEMDLDGLVTGLNPAPVTEWVFRYRQETLGTLPFADLFPDSGDAAVLPHAVLLEKLVWEACRYPNFRFIGNCRVTGLVRDETGFTGLTAEIGPSTAWLAARLIVGADGAPSAVRRHAGIDWRSHGKPRDVVWVDLPAAGSADNIPTTILDAEGILLTIPKDAKTLTACWVFPQGGYEAKKRAGLTAFKSWTASLNPTLGEALEQHVDDFTRFKIQSHTAGYAADRMRDRLLLIGDAAHAVPPATLQGNRLAMEDAVWVHPLILDFLRSNSSESETFESYREFRHATVLRTLKASVLLDRLVTGVASESRAKSRAGHLAKQLTSERVARCRDTLGEGTEPVRIDRTRFQDSGNEDPKHIYHPVRLRKIVPETSRASSFILDIPDAVKPLFTYTPGQFLTFRILIKGILYKRCYTLSSCPGVDADWQITVKRVAGGIVSTWFNTKAREGDELLALPPAGIFTYVPDPARSLHHVMFAAGSGITPIYSILKAVLNGEPKSRVTLVYGNHDEASIIFREALDKLAGKYADRFRLIHHLQRLTENSIAEFVEEAAGLEPAATEYYLCGPEGMMEAAQKVLRRRKVPEANVHFEKFVSLHTEEEMQAAADRVSQPLEMGESHATEEEIPERIVVKLNGQERTIPIRKDETVLDAALRAGLHPPYSCQSGVCSTCAAKLTAGKVRMDAHDGLSEQDIQRNTILTCQAVLLTREGRVDFDIL